MKQEWPTITLVDENDDVRAGEDRRQVPGEEHRADRDRVPGTRSRQIENDDPNAAENQPESGLEVGSNARFGVTKGS